MKKRFYAVQHGANYDWDFGSTKKREAMKMARALCKDPEYDGEEIRIAVIDEVNNFCDDELIIREGTWA